MKRAAGSLRSAGLAALALLLSCSADTGDPSPAAASPLPAASPSEVTRVLDFTVEKAAVSTTTRIPYGEGRDEVGYLPPCTSRHCERPCPCSVRMQPTSYDLDYDGTIWVLDTAKERVAMFDPSGHFYGARRLRGIGYRAWDVRIHPHAPVVLSQDQSFDGRITSVGVESIRTRPIYWQGSPVPVGGPLSVVGDSGYVAAFEEGPTGDREMFLSVPLTTTSRRIHATEVPGRPLRDGWLLLQEYRGDRVVRLAFEGEESSWETNLRFETKTARDEAPQEKGIISWELEVGPDGTIHLLVHGARGRLDDYWYATVASDGTPGEVVPLEGPRIADDQQARRLTLDRSGVPYVMWAGRKALLISSLRGVQP